MRVYLPATTTMLRELVDTGAIAPDPGGTLTAFAVTPDLREWYVDEDAEALEYAALTEAARGSLRLVDSDLGAARRRIVIALDAPEGSVTVRDDLERGAVHLAEPVTMASIASMHADDPDAEPAVTAAARAIISADIGDAASQEIVDDAEGFELSWYASQEIDAFLELL